ncbi:MAG: ABC transporter ATP-binding protein [Chloroflexi bacterium]|nr:ABC transporter ATP-binding protein [Chloroflexota bacterium]
MIVQANDVHKIYPRGQEQVHALQGVNLEIPGGVLAVVAGPSGGGKSTLLHLVGGMDRPTRGSLTVCGQNLAGSSESQLNEFRRKHIGFIFQFYNLLPSLNAVENAALPLLAQGFSRRQALSQGGEWLARLGLGERLRHKPAQLSGGEQQRVAIARALAGRAALVLADEPTGDLDSAAAEEVMDLMAELNRQLGVAFLVATHNEGFARVASHFYRLRSGRLEAA